MQHDASIENFLQTIFPGDPYAIDQETPDDIPITSLRVESGNPTDPVDLSTTSVPPIEQVVPEFRGTTVLPAPVRALYTMEEQIQVLQVSAVDFYDELRLSRVELHPALPPRGHVDGGAMASTSDRLDYLWRY